VPPHGYSSTSNATAVDLPDFIRMGAERPFASEPPQLFPDLSIVE
jgi:hypothetical protein